MTEMLDRVLDRGLVIDASLQVSVAGISLIDVDVRVVVASIGTYVRPSETTPPRALFSSPPGPTVPRQPPIQGETMAGPRAAVLPSTHFRQGLVSLLGPPNRRK